MHCSFPEHKEKEAIYYCQECKVYMCLNCQKHHSAFLINHHLYKSNKDINELFTGFCKNENHLEKLEFYCKSHNQLCCSPCIVKVKKKGKSQHTNCEVCIIEDIKKEKMNKLKDNINSLEKIKNSFQEVINKLKKQFEKINENKEKLKLNIQKIFTKIRNILNDREDELILKVEEEYDNIFLKEKNMKEYEKLPNKIKMSIEKGKLIENDWNDDNKLSLLINESINIENCLKDVNLINDKIKEFTSMNSDIDFTPDEKSMNNILDSIKNFGNINIKPFKDSLIIISNSNYYRISGENNNIITKICGDCYKGTLIKNELIKNCEYIWKIRILKYTGSKHFFIGVAPSDFNNDSQYNKCGWYLYCFDSTLHSGPPFNYCSKKTKLNIRNNEITVIMNKKERTLKFIDNDNNIEIYNDIPIDKPLYPAIFMYYVNDSIQIIKC